MKAIHKFLGLHTQSCFTVIWQPHNVWAWFCRLSGSYCCFPFSPDMFWCWVKTLFYLKKLSPEVKLIPFALLWYIGPTWSNASRLFCRLRLHSSPNPYLFCNFLLCHFPPAISQSSSFMLSLTIPIQTCFSVAEESFPILCPTHFHSCAQLIWGESACFLLMSLM